MDYSNWKFKIIVRAVIQNDRGEILLVQRAKDPDKGKWSLVGGKVNFEEEAVVAIVREVKEELNVNFSPQFLFYMDDFTSVTGDHCLVLVFSGNIQGNIKIKKDEILNFQFWSREKFQNNSQQIAFNHEEIITKYYAEE